MLIRKISQVLFDYALQLAPVILCVGLCKRKAYSFLLSCCHPDLLCTRHNSATIKIFRNILRVFLLTATLYLVSLQSAYAHRSSIIGNWQIIDQKSKRPQSIIYIWQYHNKYYGKIVQSYSDKGDKIATTQRCIRCKGRLYNRPLLGLTIVASMVFVNGIYRDGIILNPRNGKTYDCRMKLIADGERLKVRAYIGAPMWGRTMIWFREHNRHPA